MKEGGLPMMTESFTSAQTAKGEASYYAALQL